MKNFVALLLIVSLCVPAFAGLNANKSQYVGGTTTSIPKGATGLINTDDQAKFNFSIDKSKDAFAVPYANITNIAYGQHAGRRVGATVAWGAATLGIMALPMLLSKKRKHFLTLEYKDDKDVSQAAVFEVGKDAIRTTLKSLEVRTGKKVEYEDDEAKKAGNK